MSVDDKIGGYPVEWFVKAPSNNFKCGICLDVLKNPHQCKSGHTFCHSCISQALTKHAECPTCKASLSFDTLSMNLSLRNVIDEELVVKCCHDGGCEWTGTLEQSVKHFPLCSMRSVPCPLHAHHVCTDKNCTGSIKRKDVHNHVRGGSKRDVADAMLIMAETIAHQKKEIELLHKFILSGETKIHKIGQSTFVGTLKDGKKEGFGFIEQSNGVTYSGHFAKGVCCGFGVYRATRGIMSGEWENGKLNGHCVVRKPHTKEETLQNCASMHTYIGDVKDDRMHGFGRNIRTDATYVGSFENNLPHGKMTCFFPNGDIIECSFENDEICPTIPSTLTAQNGSVYVGMIDDDWYFTEGSCTTVEGTVYEGTFCDNANQFRLNGTGTITYTDGSIYSGEFKRGLKHGKGSLVNNNGQIHTAGKWKVDKPVYSTSDFDKFRNYFRIGSNCSNAGDDGALNVLADSGSDDQNNGTAGVGRKRKNSL